MNSLEVTLLERMNREIDVWNAGLQEQVDMGLMDPVEAQMRRVEPGSATHELLFAVSGRGMFNRAMRDVLAPPVDPEAILELTERCKDPTAITKALRQGAMVLRNAKGKKLVNMIDLAHLCARAS
jgi:hypothetical protein